MVGRCERASHLRMCPGMERLLRPRWFTAWTIILPVQLTLPWRRGGEHRREDEEGAGNTTAPQNSNQEGKKRSGR